MEGVLVRLDEVSAPDVPGPAVLVEGRLRVHDVHPKVPADPVELFRKSVVLPQRVIPSVGSPDLLSSGSVPSGVRRRPVWV